MNAALQESEILLAMFSQLLKLILRSRLDSMIRCISPGFFINMQAVHPVNVGSVIIQKGRSRCR